MTKSLTRKLITMNGLTGLVRNQHKDKGEHRCLNEEVKNLIEGLALQKPPKSIAHIHR